MKRTRETFIRTIPVLLVILMTVILSGYIGNHLIETETRTCWERLDSATQSTADKISTRFSGHMNLMQRVADAVVLKNDQGDRDEILEYLRSVRENTFFERIDIMLPDNAILHESGEYHQMEDCFLIYDEILAKGSHVSPRITDHITGKEVLYCVTPIVTDEDSEGFLICVIDCKRLPELFQVYSFDRSAEIFIIDCADGNYLMDSWHPELGNIKEMGDRKPMKGYEDVKFWTEIGNGIAGRAAFYSRTNGEPSYMDYMPIEGFNWSVAVMVQEKNAFSSVHELEKMLVKVALVELILGFVYLLWNLLLASALAKKNEQVQTMELEQATNDAKSLFLSSVSHDIRTPLNGILGMLDVIEKRRDDPKQVDEGLAKIRRSTQYLVSLANNVLDLNELESGKGQEISESIDLRKLPDEIEVFSQDRTKERGVHYQVECAAMEHPWVLGNHGYLHRVLDNLISNAIKYNRRGGHVWVFIEEREVLKNSSRYCFTVKDDGIGMSEEFRGSMFTAFAQEEAGARSRYQGHGLGLAIVDRMVKKMNGEIQVESSKGKGTTFTVIVPLEWDPDGAKAAESAEEERVARADLTGVRILLAEDNELNMEIAMILLSEAGAEITPAVNGKLAVEAFASAKPYEFDAVLMDVMMPEMDGCEAARMIRGMERPDAKTIPIIAMTASTFAEDIKRCTEAGMNEHMGKPLDMNILITKVAKHRDAFRGRQEAGEPTF